MIMVYYGICTKGLFKYCYVPITSPGWSTFLILLQGLTFSIASNMNTHMNAVCRQGVSATKNKSLLKFGIHYFYKSFVECKEKLGHVVDHAVSRAIV